MAIDAGIYSQIKEPAQFNPLAEMAQFEQLRGLQQQNQLGALAFGDRQRASAESDRLRGVYGQGLQGEQLENALLQSGFQPQALALADQRRKAGESSAQNASMGVKTAAGAFDNYKAILGTIQDPQQAEQFVTASYNDSTVGPLLQKMGPLEQGIQRLRQASATPQGFAQWKANAAIGIEKLAEMAKVQNVNLGGTMQTQSVQPATGQVTQLASAPITQDANSIASNQQSDVNSRRSTGASMANAAAVRETANATRDAARITARATDETGMRKEFASLPEVQNLKKATPAYETIVKASKINNPQADINLIYGLAKLYDPDSVVREGEYATIANSQAIPEWLKGQAQRLVGGGRLTDATKKQILEQATIRRDTYQNEYQNAQGAFSEIAQRRGMDPANLFTPVGPKTAAAAPAGPAVGAVQGGYRFKGGNPADKANWERQ